MLGRAFFFTLVHSGLRNLSLFLVKGSRLCFGRAPQKVLDNPSIDLQGGLPY